MNVLIITIILSRLLLLEALYSIHIEDDNQINYSKDISKKSRAILLFLGHKTYHRESNQQKFLQKMFVCKFRDVNPHYFKLSAVDAQEELKGIVFCIPQVFRLQRGAT